MGYGVGGGVCPVPGGRGRGAGGNGKKSGGAAESGNPPNENNMIPHIAMTVSNAIGPKYPKYLTLIFDPD